MNKKTWGLLDFNHKYFRFLNMNFPLTFVVLLMVAMASAVPTPKTYLIETAADEVYRRQGAVEDEPQADLGAEYEGSGSGDDYWCFLLWCRSQNINVNNG